MKRIGVWLVVSVFGIAATGCATTQQPDVYVYPKPGQTVEQFNRDQSECQAWAKQQSGYDPGTETAKGAGLGAVIGALGGAAAGAAIGAATGSAGRGAAIGAATGGIGGAAVGGGYAYTKNKEGYEKAYSACMAARGSSVGGVTQAGASAPVAPPAATTPPASVPAELSASTAPPPAPAPANPVAPRRVQVAQTSTGAPVFSQTYRVCKIEAEEVQVVSGEVEVTLIYTCKSDRDVRFALTDPGKTRLIDNKGRVWPYKESSGLQVIPVKESRQWSDPRWVTVPKGTDNRVAATLTFSPPDVNAALESGTQFHLSSEQWYLAYNEYPEVFTLAFRGLAPARPQ